MTNSTEAGAVTILGSVAINGQVLVGVDGDTDSVVNTAGGSYVITESPPMTTLSQPVLMPPVVIPAGLTCADATIFDESYPPLSSVVGEYCFDHLVVTGDGLLTADGPVTVYIQTALSFSGNTLIGVPGDPSSMLFMIASPLDTEVSRSTITGTTEFYGAIYAPDSAVRIYGTAEIFGAVTANYIDLGGTADVHYDESLRECDPGRCPDGGYEPHLLFWREI